jgi:hypothetical protein
VTGHFSAFFRIAARFAFVGGAVALSIVSASETFAQVITVPDTARADSARADSPIARADTAREVTHTVKKGDTLWDLAQYYLKDPFRWPEIFRRNTDIVENPHWIYPGEIIRIWGDQVRPEALARADSTGNVVSHIVTVPAPSQPQTLQSGGPELTIFASPLSRAAAEIEQQVVSRSRSSGVRRGEVEAAPYVDRRGGPVGPGKLIASVDRFGIETVSAEARFQLNDRVYFQPPRGLVARVGDRYMTYVMGDQLPGVGQVVVPTGIVRVESVAAGQPAEVRIVRQFGEIRIDQALIPFFDVILPGSATNPIAGGAAGKVLYVHQHPVLPSIGHYVVVSPASGSGIKVGDEFSFIDGSTGRRDSGAAPPVSAGVAQVVRVTPFAATAIIVSQTQPTIREGMAVRLTGKMP